MIPNRPVWTIFPKWAVVALMIPVLTSFLPMDASASSIRYEYVSGTLEFRVYLTASSVGWWRVQFWQNGGLWATYTQNFAAIGEEKLMVTFGGVTGDFFASGNREFRVQWYDGTWHDYVPEPVGEPPAEGEIDLTGLTELTYEVWLDTDGDGKPDMAFERGVLRPGEQYSFEPGEGIAWEVRAVEGKVGEVNVPLNQVIQSGSGGGVAAPSEVQMVGVDSIGSATVGADGSYTKGQIDVSTVTVNGQPKTTYTYQGANGGRTSQIYATSGTGALTAADLRAAVAQNSSENERILGAIGAVQAGMTVTSGTGLAWTGPDAPTNNEHEGAGQALKTKAEQGIDAATALREGLKLGMIPDMPAIDDTLGQSLQFTVNFPYPLKPFVLDLSPWSGLISAFRSFLKFVLSVMAWVTIVRMFRGTFAS